MSKYYSVTDVEARHDSLFDRSDRSSLTSKSAARSTAAEPASELGNRETVVEHSGTYLK